MSESQRAFEVDAAHDRVAARVVLVDDQHRVLLVEGHDPARPEEGWYWFTVGGGIHEGETPEEAAIRETREETGLELVAEQLGPIVREDIIVFSFEHSTLRQRQMFFVVRVAEFEPDRSGWMDLEVRAQRGMRWWTLDELRRTDSAVYPTDLVELVETCVK